MRTPPASGRSPRIRSVPRRHIQAAEPVYHVQPPRPTYGGMPSHISRHDVRLHAITLNCGTVTGLTDGIEQVEDTGRAFTVAQVGEGPPEPHRGVCVLPAILPNAGRIRLDVPGIPSALHEWRRQEPHEPFVTIDQLALGCTQRRLRARGRTAS
jgi:hypothetical protein